MKKVLPIVLVIVLAFTLMVPIFADEPNKATITVNAGGAEANPEITIFGPDNRSSKFANSDSGVTIPIVYLSFTGDNTKGEVTTRGEDGAAIKFTSPVTGNANIVLTLYCPDSTGLSENDLAAGFYKLSYKINGGAYDEGTYTTMDLTPTKPAADNVLIPLEVPITVPVVSGDNTLYLMNVNERTNGTHPGWRQCLTQLDITYTTDTEPTPTEPAPLTITIEAPGEGKNPEISFFGQHSEILSNDVGVPMPNIKLSFNSNPANGDITFGNDGAAIKFNSPVTGEAHVILTLYAPDVPVGANPAAYKLSYKTNDNDYAIIDLNPGIANEPIVEIKTEIDVPVLSGENTLYLMNSNGLSDTDHPDWRFCITQLDFTFTANAVEPTPTPTETTAEPTPTPTPTETTAEPTPTPTPTETTAEPTPTPTATTTVPNPLNIEVQKGAENNPAISIFGPDDKKTALKDSDGLVGPNINLTYNKDDGTFEKEGAAIKFESPFDGTAKVILTMYFPDAGNGANVAAYKLSYKTNGNDYSLVDLNVTNTEKGKELARLDLEITVPVVKGENTLYLMNSNALSDTDHPDWRQCITALEFTFIEGNTGNGGGSNPITTDFSIIPMLSVALLSTATMLRKKKK
ncbi:MAG: hypothetical protein LBI03_03600 [Clostridiales bacterium]|jgi:hypothetical protein|nr:hypothetical protein [Clostridiales bacterium]